METIERVSTKTNTSVIITNVEKSLRIRAKRLNYIMLVANSEEEEGTKYIQWNKMEIDVNLLSPSFSDNKYRVTFRSVSWTFLQYMTES